MQKARWVAIVLGLFMCVAAASQPTIPRKPRVAVLKFDARVWSYGGINEDAREAISEQLVKCGRFVVYERGDLDKILTEHGLAMSGLVDPTTAVKIGKFTGAQVVVCGSVQAASCETSSNTHNGKTTYSTTGKVTLHCKAIDANDGSIWTEDTVEGSETHFGSTDSSGLIPAALREAAGKLVSRLVPPISGVVVKVTDKYFIVDRGSAQGITGGSEFRIEKKGEELVLPDGRRIVEWQLVGTAHPISDGVSEEITKLCPGRWEKNLLWWKWREDRGKLRDIQIGYRVTAQPPRHQ